MSIKSSRREFLRSSTYAGVSIWIAGRASAQGVKSPNDRIRFACIGVGGKGDSDSRDAARFGDIVAICDVDENTLNGAGARWPNAKRYHDFRKMLDEMGSGIDAVTVSTPDHCHAPAAAMAMQLGKHTFCQKPLTHTIHEARRLGEIARQKRVATMMGNQGTANKGVRQAAAMIRAGVVGPAKEVHVWTNRPIWAQGISRPAPSEPPSSLHWDLWRGPAPERPYSAATQNDYPPNKGNAGVYHPFGWRGWWDFGTGALGDMACHTMNMPFMALDLRDPIAVQAETSGHNGDSYPNWSIIQYDFPATGSRPAVTLTWYDGGKVPPKEILQGQKPSSSGCLVIGEKGTLYSPNDYGAEFKLFGNATPIEVTYPESPGHFEEWVRAIKGGPAAMSNFPDYAGPLTETVLLGNLAVWTTGKRIEWDARQMRARNAPEAQHMVRKEYRPGYSI